MAGRSARPWLALTGSLLLHGSLLGGLAWTLPTLWEWQPPPPVIEARLVAPDSPAVPAPTPPAAPRPPAPLPRAVTPQPSEALPAAAEPDEAVEIGMDAIAAAPAGEDAGSTAAPIEHSPAAVAAVPLNSLPSRLDLRYQVRYGLAAGEQTLVWVSAGDRYTLTSVAGATGLAGMFYQGRFVQTSRGRITPQGLQPEEFWDQRGDRHSSARFDAEAGRITLTPARGAPRHFDHAGTVQDALSLFFQLALTAPPSQQFTYAVFNGKKLRDYTYAVHGEVVLETAFGPLRTLHLARVADDDGRFEAWLAIDRHYLPVRVVRSDDKGNAMELLLQSVVP